MVASPSCSEWGSRRRGSVLVEFALVSFALYLLMAAMLEIGRAVFASQAIQSAADTMARELATAPLPATFTFQQALESDYIRTRVFDERWLVVPFDTEFSTLPIVNQMLRPVMITDLENGVLRYPGALVTRSSGQDSYPTVLIPRVIERSAEGIETIEWVGVLEEVLPANAPPESQSHFGIDAPLKAFRGLASVRVNYPYQASTLSAWKLPASGEAGALSSQPVIADDGAVQDPGLPAGYSLTGGGSETGPYAGRYGLGRHFILLGDSVRPWRKLLSAQAVRRREVYL